MNNVHSAVGAADGQRGANVAPVHACPTHRSAAIAGVQFRIFEDLASAEPSWRRLEIDGDCTLFQTFDFLIAWQRHVGNRKRVTPATVVLVRNNDLLAILPLGVTATPIRRLIWLGQGFCDYLGPLLARDFGKDVPAPRFEALWREIRTQLQADPRFRYDVIEFCNMPEQIGGQRNPFLSLPLIRHPSSCYLVKLDCAEAEFYRRRRSAKARKQDRSKLKRMQEFGRVEIFTPDSPPEIEQTLQVLFAQKARTFARKGIPDPFQRPGYRELHFDLALSPQTRDMVHVSALRVGADTAAVNFGAVHRGRYSLLQVGYSEKYARFSPGVLHLNELFRRAFRLGLKEFDFLAGYQRLKAEWADREIPLFDHISAETVRGWPYAVAAYTHINLKRFIKQTPALWDLLVRVRAAAAAIRNRRRFD